MSSKLQHSCNKNKIKVYSSLKKKNIKYFQSSNDPETTIIRFRIKRSTRRYFSVLQNSNAVILCITFKRRFASLYAKTLRFICYNASLYLLQRFALFPTTLRFICYNASLYMLQRYALYAMSLRFKCYNASL